MKTRVRMWENCLAVRIPSSLATALNIREGSAVELEVQNGRLLVTPLPSTNRTLEALLEGVTPETLHREWDTGPAAGKEEW